MNAGRGKIKDKDLTLIFTNIHFQSASAR